MKLTFVIKFWLSFIGTQIVSVHFSLKVKNIMFVIREVEYKKKLQKPPRNMVQEQLEANSRLFKRAFKFRNWIKNIQYNRSVYK